MSHSSIRKLPHLYIPTPPPPQFPTTLSNFYMPTPPPQFPTTLVHSYTPTFSDIMQPLETYLEDNVPLENYYEYLTKLELLRLDPHSVIKNLTHGCKTKKNITKLLKTLTKKSNLINTLNLSNCNVDLINIKEMLNFKNHLKYLNLNKAIYGAKNNPDDIQKIQEFYSTLSQFKKLLFLDISYNSLNFYRKKLPEFYSTLYDKVPSKADWFTGFYLLQFIVKITSLEVLNMQQIFEFRYIPKDNSDKMIPFNELKNLVTLNVSDNKLYQKELEYILKLNKLQRLECNMVQVVTTYTPEKLYDFFINNIIKLKDLEYLNMGSLYVYDLSQNNNINTRKELNYKKAEYARTLVNKLPKLKYINMTDYQFGISLNHQQILIYPFANKYRLSCTVILPKFIFNRNT